MQTTKRSFSSLETTVDRMIAKGYVSVPQGHTPPAAVGDQHENMDDALSREIIHSLVADPAARVSPVKRRSILHRLHFFRALLLLYQDSFGDLELGHNVLQSMARTKHWPDEDVVSYIKFAVSAPLARFLKNESPPRPAGWVGGWRISCGSLARLEQHLMLNSSSRRSARYFGSYQDVKNGCCPMDDTDFLKAFRDHAVLLRQEAPPLGDEDLREFQNMAYACFSSRRGPVQVLPEVHHIEVSKRACLTQGVKQGGAAWQVELDTRILVPCAPRGDQIGLRPWFELDRPVALDLSQQWLEADGEKDPVFHHLLQDYDFVPPDDATAVALSKDQHKRAQDWPPMVEALHGTYVDEDEFRPLFDDPTPVEIWAPRSILVDHLLWYGLVHSRATVRAAAIAESLKVRIVTLGDAYTGAVAMHAQRDMWKRLHEKRQFRLIGEPLETHHLDEMMEAYQRLAVDTDQQTLLVSGDYKGATDRLNMNISKAVLERYLEMWEGDDDRTQIFKDLCRKNLYEQTITYPPLRIEAQEVQVESVLQRNGQLMGSQLSFPVLCVVNLATYWIAMERFYERRFTLSELPVLINGDDIAFPASARFIEYWKLTLDLPGFVLSVGKNFVHKKFLTMNSMLFSLTPSGFEQVKKLNVGLLVKPSSVQRKFCANAGEGIGDELVAETVHVSPASIATALVAGAQDPCFIMRRFLHYHRSSLQFWSQEGLLNYFVDPALGGLGLPLVEGWNQSYTRWQRAHALNLARKHGARIDDHTLPAARLQGYVRKSQGVQLEASRFKTLVPVGKDIDGWRTQEVSATQTLANAVPTERCFSKYRMEDTLPQWRKQQFRLSRHARGDWEVARDELLITRWKNAELERVLGH